VWLLDPNLCSRVFWFNHFPTMSPAAEPTMSESEESEEELTEYVYTDLAAAHSIRLLNLRPGGKKANEIVCELLEENLDKIEIEYEALSWSWGTDSWDERIRIHHKGEDFFSNVPRSLISALKALRYRKAVRTLWIDAICTYSHRTATKHLGTLRFAPQFFEGFNFTHLASQIWQ
jgi:hypothetical protein